MICQTLGSKHHHFNFISLATLLFYATRSGATTLDTDDCGGNPFASALIMAASDELIQLNNLATNLQKLTATKSYGHQVVECFGDIYLPNWRFREDLNRSRTERRNALVLVVSNYSDCGRDSLQGAAFDERRISAMLAQYGFSVEQGIGPQRDELIKALVSYRHRSKMADIGIIYSTGHGVEFNGVVYLIPGDYPEHKGYGKIQLSKYAVSVTHIVNSACACSQNLVFFAGCRSHV